MSARSSAPRTGAQLADQLLMLPGHPFTDFLGHAAIEQDQIVAYYADWHTRLPYPVMFIDDTEGHVYNANELIHILQKDATRPHDGRHVPDWRSQHLVAIQFDRNRPQQARATEQFLRSHDVQPAPRLPQVTLDAYSHRLPRAPRPAPLVLSVLSRGAPPHPVSSMPMPQRPQLPPPVFHSWPLPTSARPPPSTTNPVYDDYISSLQEHSRK